MNNMKRIKYFALSLLTAFMFFACEDYLNVNVDPDSPTNFTASVSSRLVATQHAIVHTHATAAHFTSLMGQHITVSNRNNDRYGGPAQWEFTLSNPRTVGTYPYQMFFISAGGNFKDLYDKAEEEGAYHYMAAVKFFRATGFMVMTDFYGEIPYTEALTSVLNPTYDDGKTIFEGCLSELEEAIELFSRTQEPGATPLAAGDSWNNGDVNKWIQMCYGFKARWLNNLTKKSSLYDPAAILAALEKAPKSNAESTVVRHEDKDANVTDPLWGDPTKTSIAYIWLVNWSRTYYLTKWYTELLTDFDGKGITDPRAGKLIPMIQEDGEFKLSDGVDMRTDVRVQDSLRAASYDTTGVWERNSYGTFVSLTTPGVANTAFSDVAKDKTFLNTGNFYGRPDAPNHFMCYPEMCFIKAEVLLRQNQTGPAFDAYKAGIRAHFDLMNERLTSYGESDNPSKTPIPEEEINAYLNSAAVGTSADLTLGKIMQQKYIALGFSHQNWNDMRRLDYSPQVYRGWEPPYEFANGYSSQASIPAGQTLRRVRQSVHEYNYNNDNVGASHPHALLDDIYSFPVWWDTVE
jgi:hypothetical protein